MTKHLDENLSAKRAGADGNIEPVELDAKQLRDWEQTRAALLWGCPAFTHILYTMMAQGKNIALFTRSIPTLATDGTTVMVNPDYFFALPLQQRVFGLGHEILHAIMDHCGLSYAFSQRGEVPLPNGQKAPYHAQLWNIAIDLIVNDVLVESKVGEKIPGILHDTAMATHMDSSVDTYGKLFEEAKKSGGGGAGQGQGRNGQKPLDQHMKPGTGKGQDPATAQQQRNPVEWKAAVAAAHAAAKARGKMPAALDRFFNDMLEPVVPWQDKIQAFFARKVGSGSFDWRRPDRRLIVRDIYAPGRSGHGAGTVAVAIDTSGSIGQTELDVFFAELRGILEEVKPKQLLLMWCDAKLHKVDVIEDPQDLHGVKPYGGGGTNFKPPFEWLEQQDITPDALVYLTDGLGTFPSHEPPYPVMWGDIHGAVKYPWGDVIPVPLKR